MNGMESITLLGWIILLFAGWAWERLFEGQFKSLHGFAKGGIIFLLCLVTAGGKVLIQNNFDFAAFNMGDWFGYASVIFLTSQAVWEARRDKIKELQTDIPPDM